MLLDCSKEENVLRGEHSDFLGKDRWFSLYSLLSMFHSHAFRNVHLPLSNFLVVKWCLDYQRIPGVVSFSYFCRDKICFWPFDRHVYDSTVNITEEGIPPGHFESLW